jgi:hypothetical protein
MTRLIFLFVLTSTMLPHGDGYAQSTPVSLGSIAQPGRVSVSSTYQRVSDAGQSINETTVPLSIYMPAGRNLGFSIHAYGVNAGGPGLPSVGGFADVLLTAHYRGSIGNTSIIGSLTANVPSGPSLSVEEFETSFLLGQNHYGFHLQSLGQGFNLAPSVTVARPVADGVVMGLGVAYQVRGGYAPTTDFDEQYIPGNEMLLTTGLDLRLGAAAVLSSDVTVAVYGRDRIGGDDVYDPGRTVSIAGQLRLYPGYNEMRLFVRYRARGGGSLVVEDVAVPVALQSVPNQLEMRWTFDSRVSNLAKMGVLAEARHFTRSEFSRPLSVVGAGLAPSLFVTSQMAIDGRFLYTIGSFTALEVGAGFSVTF